MEDWRVVQMLDWPKYYFFGYLKKDTLNGSYRFEKAYNHDS